MATFSQSQPAGARTLRGFQMQMRFPAQSVIGIKLTVLPVLQCLSAAWRRHLRAYHRERSSNPWRKYEAQKIPVFPHCRWHCFKKRELDLLNGLETSKITYKWNVSLYFGDQVLDLDFVANLRFLSARCGPIKLVSTNARNIPDWTGHLRSLAATTVKVKRKVN